jgi:hypothetical protein
MPVLHAGHWVVGVGAGLLSLAAVVLLGYVMLRTARGSAEVQAPEEAGRR